MTPGETIISFVTSSAFDPAVELVDSKGKVIASNDDIRLGVQDSLLLHRFEVAGSYKVLVKAFKGSGGGQYRMNLRRFTPVDATLGKRQVGSFGTTGIQYHRFNATVGQTMIVQAQSGRRLGLQLFSPIGEPVEVKNISENIAGVNRFVYRVEEAGAYYVRVTGGTPPSQPYALTVSAARINETKIGDNSPNHHLDPAGLEKWSFKGTSGDLVQVKASAAGADVFASLEYVEPKNAAIDGATAEAVGPAVVQLASDPKATSDTYVLLRRTGQYQVSITQPNGLETDYTFSTHRFGNPWKAGVPASSSLKLGASDYWVVDGSAGEVARIEGRSSQFDIDLDFYSMAGDVLVCNDDGARDRNALLTVMPTKTGKYLLRVQAHGDGGSGEYKLARMPDPVKPINVGDRANGSIGVGVNDIWSFKAKAGQTVIISVRSPDFDTVVTLFGPDGIEIASDDDGGDGTNSLISRRLALEGKYTIWVSGKNGAGKILSR